MNVVNYILGVLAALLILVSVIEMLRRGKLRERHALWWLIAGMLALIAALFPRLTEATAKLLGVEVPLNLLFFLGIVVLFFVNMQQASELTRAEERTRTLAEQAALLDERLRRIEAGQAPGTAPGAGGSTRDPGGSGGDSTGTA